MIYHPAAEPKLLLKSAVMAVFIEAILILAASMDNPFPQKGTLLDESQFIETSFFKDIPKTKLISEKASHPPARKPETLLSTKPRVGAPSQTTPLKDEEQNQTQEAPKLPENHGPIAAYAPAPVIPPYLQTREMKTHVVILFYVSAQGEVTPRLVRSSGNQELDFIALETVKKWRFHPAEKEHKPIDAKVPLKIIFEVR